jgi:hypothetical protein
VIKITPFKSNAAVLEMLRTWQARFDYAASALAHEAAQTVYDEVSSRLPSTKEFDNLKNSLRVQRVEGLEPGEQAYAVHADRSRLKKVKARNIKPDRNVLYVRPKRGRLARIPPEIVILARYSPWTLDSLPFFPSKRISTMYMRQVSVPEVDKVREARLKDRQIWEQSLAKVGVRIDKKDKIKIPPRAEVIEDIVFRAIRLEFGIGKEQARPAWRPVLHTLAKSGLRSMLGRDVFESLLNPSNRTWKKKVVKTSGFISSSELDNFVKFQKRLGL